NQYNFTIYEDDPNDHTVAVDPEMLGHIFENLLEDNKDKGAYYTPKEIVHYMCQESLIEYLTTWFENHGYNIINIKYSPHHSPHPPTPSPSLRLSSTSLTTSRSGNGEGEKFVDCSLIERLLKKTLNDQDQQLILQYYEQFNLALDTVKICDPALGSGAFPMGLLHEIFTAKQTLFMLKYGNTTNFNASEVKLNIIQNSIYGVDIEKGAVDIARLRFWLSLIVDENAPKALPNLDYKIVVGNSLVSKLGDDIIEIDWEMKDNKQINILYDVLKSEAILKQISEKQKEFFSPDSDKKKLAGDIRNLKIDLLISQLELMIKEKGIENQPTGKGKTLTKQTEIYLQTMGWKNTISQLKKLKTKPELLLNFFDWRLDFPEVMNKQIIENVGFDIVIGNPPYGAKLSDLDIKFFKEKYETAKTIRGIQKGSLDTFTLFIELGHNLTKKCGNIHYIVPISITSSDAMTGVHKLIESDCSEIKISSYSVRPQPVFENAVVNTSILFFKKDEIPCQNIFMTKMYRKNKELNLKYLVDNLEFINVKDLKLKGRYPKISFEIEKKILSKLFSHKSKIGDLLKEKGDCIYYRTTGGRYFKVVTNYSTGSTKEKQIFFEKSFVNLIGAILSSNLYFWFYQIFSNNLDLKSYEIQVFPLPLEKLTNDIIKYIESIYEDYLEDIEKNANIRNTKQYANINNFKEYKIGKSKYLIDKIDDIICPLFGLTKEETEFIKNYEIEFR
ncbi:MAG TPA: N-6 DNA methylase, partial [Allocoleopsis sp.]